MTMQRYIPKDPNQTFKFVLLQSIVNCPKRRSESPFRPRSFLQHSSQGPPLTLPSFLTDTCIAAFHFNSSCDPPFAQAARPSVSLSPLRSHNVGAPHFRPETQFDADEHTVDPACRAAADPRCRHSGGGRSRALGRCPRAHRILDD